MSPFRPRGSPGAHRRALEVGPYARLRTGSSGWDGRDQFTVSGQSGKIVLTGSSNVALVSAFSAYLERDADGQVARGPDHISAQAPTPATPITATSPYQYRYINNFTVNGYTG